MAAQATPYRRGQVYKDRNARSAVYVGAIIVIGFAIFGLASPNGHLVGAAGAVFMLVPTVRAWRTGLYLYPDDVKVANFLTTRRVAWSDIDKFEVRANGPLPYAAYLIRRSGRPVVIQTLAVPGRPKWMLEEYRQRVQAPIDELNQVLADRQSQQLTGR